MRAVPERTTHCVPLVTARPKQPMPSRTRRATSFPLPRRGMKTRNQWMFKTASLNFVTTWWLSRTFCRQWEPALWMSHETSGQPEALDEANDGDPARAIVGNDDSGSDDLGGSAEERIVNAELNIGVLNAFGSVDDVNDDPEIAHVLNELTTLTLNIKWLSQQMPQKPSKWRGSRKKIVARIVAKIQDVLESIAQGKVAPEDPGEGAIWVLVDSGSSIHVAGRDAHLPGASPTYKDKNGTSVVASNDTCASPMANFTSRPAQRTTTKGRTTSYMHPPLCLFWV